MFMRIRILNMSKIMTRRTNWISWRLSLKLPRNLLPYVSLKYLKMNLVVAFNSHLQLTKIFILRFRKPKRKYFLSKSISLCQSLIVKMPRSPNNNCKFNYCTNKSSENLIRFNINPWSNSKRIVGTKKKR